MRITGWRLRGTARARLSSRIVSNGKFTLWHEAFNSIAAISPGFARSLTVSTSWTISSAEKPPIEMIRFRSAVRPKYSSK